MPCAKFILPACLAASTFAAPAAAQSGTAPVRKAPPEVRSAAARMFIYGNSPGTPSTGKLATALSFYTVALAGLGTGTYLLIDHSSETDELDAAQTSGCATRAQCDAQDERRGDLNLQLALSTGAVALGTLGLLAGVTTAFTWDNESITLEARPGGVWTTWRF